jgi:hypothetical protein
VAGTCETSPVEDCCDLTQGEEIAKLSFTPNVVDGVIFEPGQNVTYRWRESTSNPFAGEASMYFGNGSASGYCNPNGNGAPSGIATMPVQSDPFPSGVLDLPAGSTVLVQFQARLDMRSESDVDLLTMNVLVQGAQPVPVWSKGDIAADKYGQWVPVSVDLSNFAGQQVQLRFDFDVVNPSAAGGCAGEGPRIDEVSVLVSDCLPPQACTSPADCDTPPSDCFTAVGATCVDGACGYSESGLCCESKADCDDGDSCTNNACVVGKCQTQQLLGCCATDADCASDNPCVVGSCTDLQECQYVPVDNAEGCCQTVSDCPAPGNTFCGGAVTCEANQCVTESTNASQTLMDFVFTDAIDGWNYNNGGQYRWRESDENFVSPDRALYFGNSDGDEYCSPFFGSPDGIAFLPGGQTTNFPTGTIQFDASGETTLSFQVYAGVRPEADVDTIIMRLVNGDSQTTLWTKADIGDNQFGTWIPVAIDLTPYAPVNGRIEIAFDVVDGGAYGGCAAGGIGLHFDDVKVEQVCN